MEVDRGRPCNISWHTPGNHSPYCQGGCLLLPGIEGKMNIYFAGMIGAGKTTLGKSLETRLGWSFDDLDDAMARQSGKPFSQVVAEEGWLGFREREYRIIKQFAAMDHTVVGLGGGTVRYEWNCDKLRSTGVNILLIAGLNTLVERVKINYRPRVKTEK